MQSTFNSEMNELTLLDDLMKKVVKAEAELKIWKNQLKLYYSSNLHADKSAFDAYQKAEIKHRRFKNQILHRIYSLQLFKKFSSQQSSLLTSRVIIGAGVAGTLVFQEIPPEFRSDVLVLNDPDDPHTWHKEGSRLMGQPAKVQTPQSFSSHSDDFISDDFQDKTNPYQYVAANDFYDSLRETQNELKMSIINLKALWIESKNTSTEKTQVAWEHSSAKYRIAVKINDQLKYIYTHAIDLCAGLGPSTKLSGKQIDSVLADKLIKSGKLVYAQDGASAELKGEVLLYGGSAVNSAWATEILSGHVKTNSKIICLVSRKSKSLSDINTLSRFISNACATQLKVAVGTLDSIQELPNGKLAVKFTSPEDPGKYPKLEEGKIIECDQLIVAIGQQKPEVTNNLPKDFEPCYYDSDLKDIPQIPLGTYSKDGSIVCWGALGTLGIGLKDETTSTAFNKKAEQNANTYPYESQAIGGIYRMSWVIPQMAKQLQEKKMFPKSETYNSQLYIIPSLNQATIEEIAPLIDHPDEKERIKLAQQIIQFRSQVMDNNRFDAPGIHTFEQLKQAIPAENISPQLKYKYFSLFCFDQANKTKGPEKTKKAAWFIDRQLATKPFTSTVKEHDNHENRLEKTKFGFAPKVASS